MTEVRRRPIASRGGGGDGEGIAELKNESEADSGSSTPVSSANSSSNDLKGLEGKAISIPARASLSLKERSRIPASLYVTLLSAYALQGCAGVWTLDTLVSYKESIVTSLSTLAGMLAYGGTVLQSLVDGTYLSAWEYAAFAVVWACVISLLVVFIIAPFRAGVWTGKRATRHRIHRFMGLAYMFQYSMAWVEFLTNYESATRSHLPLFVTINGTPRTPSLLYMHKNGYDPLKFILHFTAYNFLHCLQGLSKVTRPTSPLRCCRSWTTLGTSRTRPSCRGHSFTRTFTSP
jgi:hypothetical protein